MSVNALYRAFARMRAVIMASYSVSMPYIGLLHRKADPWSFLPRQVSMPYIGLLHNSVYRISTTIIPQNLQKSIIFPEKKWVNRFFCLNAEHRFYGHSGYYAAELPNDLPIDPLFGPVFR